MFLRAEGYSYQLIANQVIPLRRRRQQNEDRHRAARCSVALLTSTGGHVISGPAAFIAQTSPNREHYLRPRYGKWSSAPTITGDTTEHARHARLPKSIQAGRVGLSSAPLNRCHIKVNYHQFQPAPITLPTALSPA